MNDKPLAKLLNSTLPAMHSVARTLIYAMFIYLSKKYRLCTIAPKSNLNKKIKDMNN